MRVPNVAFATVLAPSELAEVRAVIDISHVPIYVTTPSGTELPVAQFAPEAQARGFCGRYLTGVVACERAPGHSGQHTDDPAQRGA